MSCPGLPGGASERRAGSRVRSGGGGFGLRAIGRVGAGGEEEEDRGEDAAGEAAEAPSASEIAPTRKGDQAPPRRYIESTQVPHAVARTLGWTTSCVMAPPGAR
jgi:hypothetical protein